MNLNYQKERFYLEDLLEQNSDSLWLEVSNKIAESIPEKRPIVDCQNVNTEQLTDKHRSLLFYYPKHQNWTSDEYVDVFENTSDEFEELLYNIITGNLSLEDPQHFFQSQPISNIEEDRRNLTSDTIIKPGSDEGNNTNIKEPKPQKPKWAQLVIPGILVLGAIALAIKSIPYFQKPKISTNTLTIGTLWTSESQNKLAEHLKKELVPSNYWEFLQGKQINIIINGDKTLPYEEAQNRIQNKQWDIAFTNSPVISIFAKDQGYSYLAAMFPESPGYHSGLFVPIDSPINSLDDIKPETIVALGSLNSASSFYMPTYALYGKTISVDMDNRGRKIIEKVKKGEADIGAAAIGDSIKRDDPELKIIYVSSQIPGAGVYLSPQLSPSDQEAIKQVMLSAPKDVQKQANYGPNIPEPDYTEFKKVIERVETILVCSDFKKNPVNLFCPEAGILSIAGKINGGAIKGNNYLLKVVSQDNKIYTIVLEKNLLGRIFGSDDLSKVQNKSIQITVPFSSPQGNIKITQPRQLKLISD